MRSAYRSLTLHCHTVTAKPQVVRSGSAGAAGNAQAFPRWQAAVAWLETGTDWAWKGQTTTLDPSPTSTPTPNTRRQPARSVYGLQVSCPSWFPQSSPHPLSSARPLHPGPVTAVSYSSVRLSSKHSPISDRATTESPQNDWEYPDPHLPPVGGSREAPTSLHYSHRCWPQA